MPKINWPKVMLWSELVKLAGIPTVLALTVSTSCSAKPITLHGWIIMVIALTGIPLFWLGFVVVYFFACSCSLARVKEQLQDDQSISYRTATQSFIAWDVLSIIMFGIGIAVVTSLDECPELGGAIAGVVYLGVLIARSTVCAIGWWRQ